MALAYEVYCYYNVDTLKAVFEGVALILNGSGYANLIKVVLTLGVLIMAMVSLSTGKFEGMKWFIVSCIFYFGFLGPKVNIMLVDRVAVQPPVVVANVPIGLAFMAHFTSSVGDWMTTTMESTFITLPSTMTFHGAAGSTVGETHGLVFGSRLLSEARQSVIADPQLRMDWQDFIRNCTIYDIAAGRVDMTALQKSADIFATLSVTSQARMTSQHETGQPAMDSCKLVVGNLIRRLNVDVLANVNYLGRFLNPNTPQLTPNAAVASMLNTQFVDMNQVAFGVTQGAQATIQQAMGINLVNASGAVIGQQLNDPAAVSIALAQAQAEATANASYMSMAAVASSAMPKIRNVIEVVIYATFPIVMLIILIAGHRAGMPLKAYFMTMIWLQLWPPLYAILNLVVTMETAKETLAIAMAQGGLPLGGLTIASAADLGATSLSAQAIEGYMTMLIPVIAGAITKGGEQAMTSLASSLTTPAQQAASTAGAAVATGNVSLGNTSLDNHTAHNNSSNKLDTNYSSATGLASLSTSSGGKDTAYSTGNGIGVAVEQLQNNVSISANATESLTRSRTQGYETAQQNQQSAQETLTEAQAATLTTLAMAGDKATNGFKSTSTATHGVSSEAMEASEKVTALAHKFQEQTGMSYGESMDLSGKISAGSSLLSAVGAMSKSGRTSKGQLLSTAFTEMAKGFKGEAAARGVLSGASKKAMTIMDDSSVSDARKSAKKYTDKASMDTKGEMSKGFDASGSNELRAQNQKTMQAQTALTESKTATQTAKDSLQEVAQISAQLQSDSIKDPDKLRHLSETTKVRNADGTESSWTPSELANTHNLARKQGIQDAIARGLGFSDVGKKVAGSIKTQEQVANQGADRLAATHTNNAGQVDASANRFNSTVKAQQNALGVNPDTQKQKVAAAVNETRSGVKGMLINILGQINDSGTNLGKHQKPFEDAVRAGSAEGALTALGHAISENKGLAIALGAGTAGGALLNAMEGYAQEKHRDSMPDGVDKDGKSSGKGAGAEPEGKPGSKGVGSAESEVKTGTKAASAAEHEAASVSRNAAKAEKLGRISKFKAVFQTALKGKNAIRAAELTQAATGPGLLAAIPEAVITESLFALGGAMLAAEEAEAKAMQGSTQLVSGKIGGRKPEVEGGNASGNNQTPPATKPVADSTNPDSFKGMPLGDQIGQHVNKADPLLPSDIRESGKASSQGTLNTNISGVHTQPIHSIPQEVNVNSSAGSSRDATRQPEPPTNAPTQKGSAGTPAPVSVTVNPPATSDSDTGSSGDATRQPEPAANAPTQQGAAGTPAPVSVVVNSASGTDDSGTVSSGDATRQPEPATTAQTSQTGTAASATNATGEVVINQSNSSMLTDEQAVAIANQTDAVSATDTNNTAPKITRHADGTVVVDQSNEEGAKSPAEKDSVKSSPDK